MARVCGVIAARTAAGSMFRVSGSTSTSTGRAPTCSITFTEAVKVSGVVMTSSPAPTPSVASAVCRPAVHELRASAPGASRDAANSVSKRLVFGPERRAGIGGGARTRGNQERSFARLPRHVLRHEARDGVDQLVARAVGQDLEQVLEITLHRRPVRSVALDDADLVDGGGDGVLGARHELFGEFLAGAESGARDLNVAVGLEARQPDQLLRELGDA